MKPAAAHARLLWWERQTLAPADLALPGWLPFAWLNQASVVLGLLPLLVLPPLLWPLAVVFGRLMALDLVAYVLPNVYTLPLTALGLAQAVHHGQWLNAGLALALLGVATFCPPRRGLGAADLKLLAAMLAWLPLHSAAFAVAAGCLLWLPLAFGRPRAAQPFGVPLICGWVIILAFPHLQEATLRPILGW